MLTGWSLEDIDQMGVLDQEDLLQVYEAEMALKNNPKKKPSKRGR